MGFPEKNYDRLCTLGKRWQLSQEDIYYAIENGMLRVCVWMPLRFVERCVVRENKLVFENHETKEGFIGLRPKDFYRLSSTGRVRLRIFQSIKCEGHVIRLAVEPPQPAISITLHDLVVLKADRELFEKQFEITPVTNCACPPDCATPGFSASADYHHVKLNGEDFNLGDVQAQIVQQLHDASISKNQWVHGKTLLYGANSRALRVRDVFKSKLDWNKLILSDRRGYYRLNLPDPSAEKAVHVKAA